MQEKKTKGAPQAQTVTDISAVDLKVGVLTNVRRHENADSLYVEDVQCGEAEPRQVVSGLVKHIPIVEMEGRKVVIVANLKAGNMRGVKSQAMVLAASSSDGSKVAHLSCLDAERTYELPCILTSQQNFAVMSCSAIGTIEASALQMP